MKFKKILAIPVFFFATSLIGCNFNDARVTVVEGFENSEKYQSGNRVINDYSSIKKIDIYWNNGEVNLVKDANYSVMIIQESNCSHDEAEIPLQSYIDEEQTLSIHFLQPGTYDFDGIKKDIKIIIPASFAVETFSVHTISANLTSNIDFNDGYFYSQTGNAVIADDNIHYLFVDSRYGMVDVESENIHHFFSYNFYGTCSLKTETFDIYEIRCETGTASLDILGSAADFSFRIEFSKTSGEFVSNREYTVLEENKYLYGSEESEIIGNAVVNINDGKFILF